MNNLISGIDDIVFDQIISRAAGLSRNGICCPLQCGITRTESIPPCGADSEAIKVASFYAHKGEEPPVSGVNGAGNVFFSGCTLSCVFCQNFPFSHLNNGKKYSCESFCEKIRELLSNGVHNLNFTTFDHYMHLLLVSLRMMKDEIHVPISNNCSGYYTKDSLDIALSFCDIFLYDVKYGDDILAAKYSSGKNYVYHCWNGVDEFARRKLEYIEEDSLLKNGVIFRHLVLPSALENTVSVLEKLAKIRDRWSDFRVSLMSQYFPTHRSDEFAEINRKLTEDEYGEALNLYEHLGFDGWVQELEGSGGC